MSSSGRPAPYTGDVVDLLADARELAWWRQVFSTRFISGCLPKPDTPLHGRELRVYEVMPDGSERPYEAGHRSIGR